MIFNLQSTKKHHTFSFCSWRISYQLSIICLRKWWLNLLLFDLFPKIEHQSHIDIFIFSSMFRHIASSKTSPHSSFIFAVVTLKTRWISIASQVSVKVCLVVVLGGWHKENSWELAQFGFWLNKLSCSLFSWVLKQVLPKAI